METGQPYLSVVVTARNDDHGGNLLGRMQIFVNGWIAQARRHELPSELIIVEWNPPMDRPRLEEMLHWPEEFGPCDVRFLDVPAELHRRYQHAEALPLYQMIAKNVGIRRARGRFILATNIDILFSDELMAFIAAQRLEPDRMYRIDRHDVVGDVPVEARVQDQLAYCRAHLLRLNAREGTFPLTRDGRRGLAVDDIAAADSGLRFGHGWFPVEHYWDGEVFRWVDNDAELDVDLPPGPRLLRLELEPGPSMGQQPLVLHVFDGPRAILKGVITRRSLVRIPFSRLGPDRCRLRLHVVGGGEMVPHDPRSLNFRVFSCVWERFGVDRGGITAIQTAIRRPVRAWKMRDVGRAGVTAVASTPVYACKQVLRLWHGFQELLNRLAASGPLMTITVFVPKSVRRASAFYVGWGGFSGMFLNWTGYLLRKLGLRSGSKARSLQPNVVKPGLYSPARVTFLHTNACGDFTLLARERWFDLRAYPEFDLFSMNIDSVFCYAAHHGGVTEEVLPEPMRIYHIEHGTGSGWTPEGQAQLFARIAAKGLTYVSYEDLVNWAAHMRRLGCPMIFNHENWGLAEFDLKESRPQPAAHAPVAAQLRVRRAGDSE